MQNHSTNALVVLGPSYYKPSDEESAKLNPAHTINQKNRLYFAIFQIWPIKTIMKITRDSRRFNMLLNREKVLIKFYRYQTD